MSFHSETLHHSKCHFVSLLGIYIQDIALKKAISGDKDRHNAEASRKRGICLHSIMILLLLVLYSPMRLTRSSTSTFITGFFFSRAQKWPFILPRSLHCSKPFNKLFICAGVSHFGRCFFPTTETFSICLSCYDGILLGNWILGVTFFVCTDCRLLASQRLFLLF